MAAPEYPTFVLDAIKKEVQTQYRDTDMLCISEKSYPKRQLLYALDAEDPLILGPLEPSITEVVEKPTYRRLALLYLSGKPSVPKPVRDENVEKAIYLLSEEVAKFSPSATLYIDEVEYPKNTILLALRERDPALMSYIEPLSRRILEEKYSLKYAVNKLSHGGEVTVDGQTISLGKGQLGWLGHNVSITNRLNDHRKKCFVISPSYNPASEFSNMWIESLMLPLSDRYHVVRMGGCPLHRKDIENVVVEQDPGMIIFYDHGRKNRLRCSETEDAFDMRNVDLLSEKTVYTCACLSASELGKEAFNRGCNMYWGNRLPIMFSTVSLWAFRKYANNGLVKHLLGYTWDEAFDDTQLLGENLIDFLLSKGKILESMCIMNNADGLAMYVR
jgi:hypothetical protein